MLKRYSVDKILRSMDKFNRKKIEIKPKKISRSDGCYWIPNRCINEHYLTQRLEELGKHEELYNADHRQRKKEVQKELLNIRTSRDTKNGMKNFKRKEKFRQIPKSRDLSLTEMIDKFKMKRVEDDLLNELMRQQRCENQYIDVSDKERSTSKLWETTGSSKADTMHMGINSGRESKEKSILDEMKASLDSARKLSTDSTCDEIFNTVQKQKRNSYPSIGKQQNGYGRKHCNGSKINHERNTVHTDRNKQKTKRTDRPKRIIGEQTTVVHLNVKRRIPIYAEKYYPRQPPRVSEQRINKVKMNEKEQTEHCAVLVRERTLYQDDMKSRNKVKPSTCDTKNNAGLNRSKDDANLNGSKDNTNLNGSKGSANLIGSKDNTNLNGSKDDANLNGSKGSANLNGSKDNTRLIGSKDNSTLNGSKYKAYFNHSKEHANLNDPKGNANYQNEDSKCVSLNEKVLNQSMEKIENESSLTKGINVKYFKKEPSAHINNLNSLVYSEAEFAKTIDIKTMNSLQNEPTKITALDKEYSIDKAEDETEARKQKVKETTDKNSEKYETNCDNSNSGVLHNFCAQIREPTELIYFLEDETEKATYEQKFVDKLERIKKKDEESGKYNDLYKEETFEECEVEGMTAPDTWADVRRCRYLRGYDPPEMIMPQEEINIFVFGRDENDILEIRRKNQTRLPSELENDTVNSDLKKEH